MSYHNVDLGSRLVRSFFYSYIFHERIAFIVFIVVWGVFIIALAVIGFLTIKKSENEKLRKKIEKEDRERQMKEIMEAKRKRNLKSRNNLNNNMFEINTNIDDNNKAKFENESERIPVITSEKDEEIKN